jgi:hypothetical protein
MDAGQVLRTVRDLSGADSTRRQHREPGRGLQHLGARRLPPQHGGSGSGMAEAPPAVRPAGQPRKRKPRRIPKAPMIAPAGAGSVYTDGACSGNPGPGGRAWAIDRDTWASGSEPVSTNQRPRRRGRLLQTVAGAPACPARRPRPGRVVLGRIHHDRAGADRDLGPAAVAWSRRSKPMDRRARAPRWPS